MRTFLLIMSVLPWLKNVITKKITKKIAKIFGQSKKVFYFCTWRDGRVVDCGGLENR